MEKLSFLRRTLSAFALLSMIAGTTVAMADSSSSTSGYTTISITDGKASIAPGGTLLYVITLTRHAGAVGYSDLVVTIPSEADTLYPDRDGRVAGNRVIWDKVSVSQGEKQIFTVSVKLKTNISSDTEIRAIAQTGNLQASDVTSIVGRLPDSTFRVNVTDNLEQVYPGETMNYVVTVRNTSASSTRTDVTANVTALQSVDKVSPAAMIAYPIITWKDVYFEPNEQKTFTFNAVMRKRQAPYTAARVIARAGTYTATDTTVSRDLHGEPTFMVATERNGITTISSRDNSSRASSVSSNAKSVLFRKTADAGDVVPGGTIRYTFLVQNVLLNTVRDAVITERFDPSVVTVVDAGGGKLIGDGVIQWTLPVLQSGETWRTSYTVRVSSNLKNGASINSVATLSGKDVGTATLNEKVTVSTTTSVVGNLPATGAAMDLLFMVATAPLAFAGMKLQRRTLR